MRGGVQLPELANAGTLPTAYRGQDAFGRDWVSQMIVQSPTAHLGSVELEGVKPEGLGSGKAVGARRRTAQSFAQEFHNRLGPGRGMVAARAAGNPVGVSFLRAGVEVFGGQRIETTGGQTELFRRLSRAQRPLPEGVEHMADE